MSNKKRRRTRADEIYDELRRIIVALELQPGAVLSEKELCERFAVSRTPVREAMLRLADQGMVAIRPQHASFVAGIDPDAVRQAHFLRENLEMPTLARLCAMTPDLASARELVEAQAQLVARNDFAGFIALDDRFHAALFALAGLDQVWSAIHAKKAHLDRVRFLQAPQRGKLETLVAQHDAILRALAARNVAEAQAVMSAHIAGALTYMEALLAREPGLFAGTGEGRVRRSALAESV